MTAFTVCSCVLFITEQKILDNSSTNTNRNNICIISYRKSYPDLVGSTVFIIVTLIVSSILYKLDCCLFVCVFVCPVCIKVLGE